jgi:hypothetical protein
MASPPDDADQEQGRRAFGAYLAGWGSWDEDLFYSVRWCPAREELPANLREFWPYARTSSSPEWLEITSARGHWVLDETGGKPWCWVPGVALTGPDVRVRRGVLSVPQGEHGPSEEERMRREQQTRDVALRSVVGVVGGVLEVVFGVARLLRPVRR